MDSFTFDFNIDSTLINETNNSHCDLDWTAFQSAPPQITNNSFSPIWLSQQDDAVAPNNQTTTTTTTPQNDEIYFEIEHLFNGFNPQQQQQQTQSQPINNQQQEIIEPIHVNIDIPDQTMNDRDYVQQSPRTHLSFVINERPTACLPGPLVPRVSSSSRSQCYHKLPDHAVKLMQEWYNANLDDPYPRSPDKKRFITEGNITPQQCRSWFANRRQRLKHVKRNQTKTSSRSNHSLKTKLNEIPTVETTPLTHENCYYCQQQQIALSSSSSSSSTLTIPGTSPTATTLNVVINQQTVEQLIHNSLRKLLYPALM